MPTVTLKNLNQLYAITIYFSLKKRPSKFFQDLMLTIVDINDDI